MRVQKTWRSILQKKGNVKSGWLQTYHACMSSTVLRDLLQVGHEALFFLKIWSCKENPRLRVVTSCFWNPPFSFHFSKLDTCTNLFTSFFGCVLGGGAIYLHAGLLSEFGWSCHSSDYNWQTVLTTHKPWVINQQFHCCCWFFTAYKILHPTATTSKCAATHFILIYINIDEIIHNNKAVCSLNLYLFS